MYQETNAIYDDRPILNNFTYGNQEQEPNLHIDTTYIKDNEDNKNQNQNQNQNLFVSDHEYDELKILMNHKILSSKNAIQKEGHVQKGTRKKNQMKKDYGATKS